MTGLGMCQQGRLLHRRFVCLMVVALTCLPVAGRAADGQLGTPPSGDATALVQGALEAAGRDLVLPCGTWNVTGLKFVPGGVHGLRGEALGCAALYITTDAPALHCSDISSDVAVHDLTIVGSAPSYGGVASPRIEDRGQSAIYVRNCPNVTVRNVRVSNISGTAFDCEHPASDFPKPAAIVVDGLRVTDSYRAIHLRNACEYALVRGLVARNNVFGAVIAAGNVRVSSFIIDFNSVGIKIVGQPNANPCHGAFVNGASNHNAYNLDVTGCALGHEFVGVSMIGDQDGSLRGGGFVRIANSRMVNLVGGTIGSRLVLLRCEPTGNDNCALAGSNLVANNIVRDDIPGWRAPASDYSGGIVAKNNISGRGLVGWNN